MSKKKGLVLFLSILIGLSALVYANIRGLIYLPLHRNQPSPANYLKKFQKLLPEAASTSLQVVEHGSRKTPKIALTFDADMTPGMLALLKSGLVKSWYNAPIKETLDTSNTKATVFLGGLWTRTYPNEAKSLAADPLIEIGNHSYNHYAFASLCYSLPLLSNDQNINDVGMAQKIISETTGITPKYFRFPGGCYESIDIQTVARLGLTIVHWDTVAGDGFNNSTDNIVYQVESRVQNGSIIVMHIHDSTYAPKTNAALLKIIPDLKKRGFEFVKVSELLQENN